MTARHQLRIGNRRLGRDRAPIDATPAPPVGETLQLARERKGVDLYRAERDTKIRLRYLAALEDGAYEELPAPVYTKGFLRNYAIYLGLEPEEILERWRDEMEALAARTSVAVAPPPQPIAAPARAARHAGHVRCRAGGARHRGLRRLSRDPVAALRRNDARRADKPPDVVSTIDDDHERSRERPGVAP